MSKILVVPDIHGELFFDIRQLETFVKTHGNIVFLGDYWDSYDKSQAQQEFIFLQVMELKASYPDKVTLLVGNHDCGNYMYAFNPDLQPYCSGFQERYKYRIADLMEEHKNKFQLAYEKNSYLFTHAGLTKIALKDLDETYGYMQQCFTLANVLNEAYNQKDKRILYCGKGNGGNDPYDSCLWVRPNTLNANYIDGYIQVVGHTPSYALYNGIKAQVVSKNVIYCDSQQLTIIDV